MKDKSKNIIIKIVYGIAIIAFVIVVVIFSKYNAEPRKGIAKTKMEIDYTKMTAQDPRDGQVYNIVIIGEQVWLAENFNFDPGLGSWCYENKKINCKKLGRLYNWETAHNIAPAGWHIPSKMEWETMLKNLGGKGFQAYKKMTPSGASGFNALLAGYRRSGTFFDSEQGTVFWSSSESDDKHAWACYVYQSLKSSDMINYKKDCGFSIRLIKDKTK